MSRGKVLLIVAGSVLSLLLTVFVVKKIANHGEWIWRVDARNVDKVPPMVRIRPAKELVRFRHAVSWRKRIVGKSGLIRDMIQVAYDVPPTRISLGPGVPDDRYDFLSTVTTNAHQALQAEITNYFKVRVKREFREADAFVLKVKSRRSSFRPSEKVPLVESGQGYFRAEGSPISAFVQYLEGRLEKPVVDGTEMTGLFDMQFYFGEIDDRVISRKRLDGSLMNSLGMELIPQRMKVEYLVVEKVP